MIGPEDVRTVRGPLRTVLDVDTCQVVVPTSMFWMVLLPDQA